MMATDETKEHEPDTSVSRKVGKPVFLLENSDSTFTIKRIEKLTTIQLNSRFKANELLELGKFLLLFEHQGKLLHLSQDEFKEIFTDNVKARNFLPDHVNSIFVVLILGMVVPSSEVEAFL